MFHKISKSGTDFLNEDDKSKLANGSPEQKKQFMRYGSRNSSFLHTHRSAQTYLENFDSVKVKMFDTTMREMEKELRSNMSPITGVQDGYIDADVFDPFKTFSGKATAPQARVEKGSNDAILPKAQTTKNLRRQYASASKTVDNNIV